MNFFAATYGPTIATGQGRMGEVVPKGSYAMDSVTNPDRVETPSAPTNCLDHVLDATLNPLFYLIDLLISGAPEYTHRSTTIVNVGPLVTTPSVDRASGLPPSQRSDNAAAAVARGTTKAVEENELTLPFSSTSMAPPLPPSQPKTKQHGCLGGLKGKSGKAHAAKRPKKKPGTTKNFQCSYCPRSTCQWPYGVVLPALTYVPLSVSSFIQSRNTRKMCPSWRKTIRLPPPRLLEEFLEEP